MHRLDIVGKDADGRCKGCNQSRRRKSGEKERARTLAWAKANPEKTRAHRTKRRARLREMRAGTCAYCGAPATSMDHCTPISRGGANAADNLVDACETCNKEKHDKTVLEFLGLWPRRGVKWLS